MDKRWLTAITGDDPRCNRSEGEQRCREQNTLACVGLAAALRRLNRRKRLRANLLAAMANRIGHE